MIRQPTVSPNMTSTSRNDPSQPIEEELGVKICQDYGLPWYLNKPINEKKASRAEQGSQVAVLSGGVSKSWALSYCLQFPCPKGNHLKAPSLLQGRKDFARKNSHWFWREPKVWADKGWLMCCLLPWPTWSLQGGTEFCWKHVGKICTSEAFQSLKTIILHGGGGKKKIKIIPSVLAVHQRVPT